MPKLTAFWCWVWWAGDRGLCFPFWFFLRFEGRPAARKYWTETLGHKPDIWVKKGAYE